MQFLPPQVVGSDAGQYACQAINALGTGPLSSSTEAKVRAPPRFEQKPRSYYQVTNGQKTICGQRYHCPVLLLDGGQQGSRPEGQYLVGLRGVFIHLTSILEGNLGSWAQTFADAMLGNLALKLQNFSSKP